jgi:tRNA threonylcarbamoyladenosine biosynthesis protein TsaE
MTVRLTTRSAHETEAFGAALGRTAPAGALLALIGELGAGKTRLVRGLARGLGADTERVQSPSFVIATEYPGGRLPLHHVDLYRLETAEIDELFFRDILYGDGVAAVEWFDRLPPPAPTEILVLTLRHGRGDERTIDAEATGPRHEAWLSAAVRE